MKEKTIIGMSGNRVVLLYPENEADLKTISAMEKQRQIRPVGSSMLAISLADGLYSEPNAKTNEHAEVIE